MLSKPLTPPLQSDDVRLLTEVGFVAAAAGLQTHSDTIFHALLRLRPERAFAYIGLATGHLNGQRAEEAQSILQRGLAVLSQCQPSQDPHMHAQWLEDRSLLAAFHALALQICGRRAESAQALRQCLDIQSDGPGARMARAMLGLPVQDAHHDNAGVAPPQEVLP